MRKSASARDSHARRICLEFPRERPWRSPWPGAAVEKVSSAVTGSSTWPRRAKIRHCLSCRCLTLITPRGLGNGVSGISLNPQHFARLPPLFLLSATSDIIRSSRRFFFRSRIRCRVYPVAMRKGCSQGLLILRLEMTNRGDR